MSAGTHGSEPRPTALFGVDHVVLLSEVDSTGRLFYSRIFEFFSRAFIEFLGSRGIDLAKVLSAQLWAAPVVHAEADYTSALSFGQAIRIEVCEVVLGKSSLTVAYRIVAADAPSTTFGTGRTTQVFIDVHRNSSTPIPDDVRRALS